MNQATISVFSIGHSNHTLEKFAELLRAHNINAVADVRSDPYSRFNPQFNRESLQVGLEKNGIRYVFLGRELGARSEDRRLYEKGRVSYARLAETVPFRQGISRVIFGARDFRIALMCAEKEPLECHRTLLVSRALADQGLSIGHIHADGVVESHDDAMARLLDLTGLPREDLFLSKKNLIAEALSAQEKKVAYLDETMAKLEPRENL